MYSNCCGAEPSRLSDEMCGRCKEWASFEEEQEEEQSKFESDRQKEFMDNYRNEISEKELQDLMNMFYNK